MTDYFFETTNTTFVFVDEEVEKHIKLSLMEGSDKSFYLTINSSTGSVDYIKISYHPRLNELRYAFTSEYWRNKSKPNHERVKFLDNPSSPDQILAKVYIDKWF